MTKVMLNNKTFLTAISDSFDEFLSSGTSRSTAKLKPLHGVIAKDIADRLGNDYQIFSQGYGTDKESTICGRYMDKRVDITITKNGEAVAGIGVKFVMQNYSQNSNNYFENMLGETANIRSAKRPYFQIFIILDKLPYYNKETKITRWETFTDHNVSKYVSLSQDDINTFFHTPNKTLIYVVHIPDNDELTTSEEYLNFYKNHNYELQLSPHQYADFGSAVILNDYETFINKVYYTILAI